MIVTDRLVFLHLHKSGGTFVNALLMRCAPSAMRVGYHLPYRELPEIYRNLPVIGTVRSPWAYYVSWYHFQRSQQNPNILFKICSTAESSGSRRRSRTSSRLSGDEARLGQLEEGVPDHFVNHGLNLTKRCVGELRERGLGFYSFLYARLYDGAREPMVVRVEELRNELRSALSSLGHVPAESVRRNVPRRGSAAQHLRAWAGDAIFRCRARRA